jgi:hypothetical protein
MAVCSEIHTKHINTAVWVERRVCAVKLVVHIMTNGLIRNLPSSVLSRRSKSYVHFVLVSENHVTKDRHKDPYCSQNIFDVSTRLASWTHACVYN